MIAINKALLYLLLGALLTMSSTVAVAEEGVPFTILILPFENSDRGPSVDNLQEAISELLEVFFSHSGSYAVVDRKRLDSVLAEQSLTLKGLVPQEEKQKIGKILGAKIMITGGIAEQDETLFITAHAFDIASGRLLASAGRKNRPNALADMAKELYGLLIEDLQTDLPDAEKHQIDESPISSLHFMRGLSLYYSAKYNQALGEFMQAAQEKGLSDISGFWKAKCYLAQKEYGHAYVELKRLTRKNHPDIRAGDVERRIDLCLEHLSSEDIRLYNQMLSP